MTLKFKLLFFLAFITIAILSLHFSQSTNQHTHIEFNQKPHHSPDSEKPDPEHTNSQIKTTDIDALNLQPEDYYLFNPSEKFKEFYNLKTKYLKSRDDLYKLDIALNDYETLSTAMNTLDIEIKKGARISTKNERERMDATLYITSALSQASDPGQKSLTIDFIKKLLMKDYRYIDDIELKKSLIGDQLEMGLAIKNNHPEEWEKILINSDNLFNTNLIKHIQSL